MQIIKKIINILAVSCLMLIASDDHARGGHGRGGHRGGRGHGGRGRHHAGRGRYAGRGFHRGSRGYGRRGYYGGYGRGYGWGGGWWGVNPWIGYPWWSSYWGPGYINRVQYRYTIPQTAINDVYGGNYDYWGYGLGADNELDQLAQQNKWSQVKQRLITLGNQYQEELNQENKKAPGEQDADRIKDLQDKLNKVQLHLHGMRSEKTQKNIQR